MAHSIIEYQGDGSTNTWSINFTLGYADKEDVTAWVVGEEDVFGDPVFRTITWVTDTTVNISGAVPQVGEVLRFQRTTDLTQPEHDFLDGSRMNAANFDDNQLQVLHLIQELKDGRIDSLQGLAISGLVLNSEGVEVPNGPFHTLDFIGDAVAVADAGNGMATVSVTGGSGGGGAPNSAIDGGSFIIDSAFVDGGSFT